MEERNVISTDDFATKRLLFVMVCGPGFVTKRGRDEVLTVVADAEHRIRKERTTQRVVPKLPRA